MKTGILITTFIAVLFVSCNRDNRLEMALSHAKDNRSELEKVLRHYQTEDENPLKYKAACFLIENMPYHFTKEEYFMMPGREHYVPDITLFADYKGVEQHCDSLLQHGYRTESRNTWDISVLDSAYLVENIDLAFSVWQKPWAKEVSFDDFCRYILPYRSQIEVPTTLRRELRDRFLPLLDSAGVTSPLEACILLNKRLKDVMKYQYTGLILYPTTKETYRSGIGLCEGICNLGIVIMRSVGIPVTVDQASWTKMDRGHNWCVIFDKGIGYSFGAGEDQPGEHAQKFLEKPNLRPAKVYRLRFDLPPMQKVIQDDGYRLGIKSPLLYDVTKEYLSKVTDLKVAVDKETAGKGKSNQVYLCAFNFNEWRPIAVGNRQGSHCMFKEVVGDNIFIVADSPDGSSLRYITIPFYMDENGGIHKFQPQLDSYLSHTLEKVSDRLAEPHTLYYWDTSDDQFIPIAPIEKTEATQSYDRIPSNALLWWFTTPKNLYNQRVFFIENDSIRKY